MEIFNNNSTGAFAWAPSVMGARSVAPKAQFQGTGVPAAGYAITTGMSAHRTDDVTVPDPRGRKR